MQKRHNISLSIAAVILLALTACGSIWDFEIANAVYIGQSPSENIFGILFSYIGILPTFVGWSFLGASIFRLSQKQIGNTRKRRWLIAFAVLLFVLSLFYFCNTLYLSNANAFKVHFAVAYSIGIAVIVYVIPCVFLLLGYFLGQAMGLTEMASVGVGGLGILVGFRPAILLNRYITKREGPEFIIRSKLG